MLAEKSRRHAIAWQKEFHSLDLHIFRMTPPGRGQYARWQAFIREDCICHFVRYRLGLGRCSG